MSITTGFQPVRYTPAQPQQTARFGNSPIFPNLHADPDIEASGLKWVAKLLLGLAVLGGGIGYLSDKSESAQPAQQQTQKQDGSVS